MTRALRMLLFLRDIGMPLEGWQRQVYIVASVSGMETLARRLAYGPRKR